MPLALGGNRSLDSHCAPDVRDADRQVPRSRSARHRRDVRRCRGESCEPGGGSGGEVDGESVGDAVSAGVSVGQLGGHRSRPGKDGPANMLVVLDLPAFAFHCLLDSIRGLQRGQRERLGPRCDFYENVRAIRRVWSCRTGGRCRTRDCPQASGEASDGEGVTVDGPLVRDVRAGTRRLYLRGRLNIRKRPLLHARAYDPGVLMSAVTGAGTPRTLQGRGRQIEVGRGTAANLPPLAVIRGVQEAAWGGRNRSD